LVQQTLNPPKYNYPNPNTPSIESIIHPARGTSIMRYGRGVWYDIASKIDDGAVVFVFPSSRQLDMMKKYEWVWVERKENRAECGWVSLLIPFEEMFEEVEQSDAK